MENKNNYFQIFTFSIIFSIISILFGGYGIHIGNHPLQIPIVQKLNCPSLYCNDYFVNTLRYYCSELWLLIAYLSRFLNLEIILFLGFIFEKVLLMYSVARLANSFYPKSEIAIITSMIAFSISIRPILGGGTIVSNYFEQTALFIPFFILSVVYFYEQRYYLWSIMLAICANLNVMYTAFGLTYFFAIFIFNQDVARNWRKFIRPSILLLILSIPVIKLSYESINSFDYDKNLWIKSSAYLLSCHLYPLSWEFSSFLKYAVLTISIYFLKSNKYIFKQNIIWAIVSLLWLTVSFIVAYYVQIPNLIVLHPARATDLWYCFVIISLISTFSNRVEYESNKLIFNIVGLVVSVVALSSLSDLQVLGFFILISMIMIKFRLHSADIHIFSKSIRNSLIVIVSILSLWVYYDRGYTFNKEIDHDIVEAAGWIRSNSKIDSVVIVNPRWELFREISKRSTYVTIKDGAAFLWQKSFISEWYDRMVMLGFDIKKEKSLKWNTRLENAYDLRYNALNDNRIKVIKEKYKVDYWLVVKDKRSNYKAVYNNDSIKILQISEQ